MCCGQCIPAINVINLNCNIWSLHPSLVSLWKEHNRRSKSGWRWLTHHPPYVYFIDWTLDQEEELEEYGATLDLGLSHFNSLRQQTALTTTVSTKKASPSDYSYTYSTTSTVVWMVAKKRKATVVVGFLWFRFLHKWASSSSTRCGWQNRLEEQKKN